MIKQESVKIVIGILAVIFSSYLVITDYEMVSLPFVQLLIGIVISVLSKWSVSAFHDKAKKSGLFNTVAAVCLFAAVIVANDFSIQAILPLLAMAVFFGVPISIMAMFAYRMDKKRQFLE